MKFSGLYLSGFKSFPEPTEIAIKEGLTGIVGPNGCGKSNLVEALRWVMGESVPGRVRLGEMSEIIFAGTDRRPPRNIAEVRLGIRGLSAAASTRWGGDEAEVRRRLERGGASKWYINEQSVRAADVSLLLVGAATGARTAAIISQGEVNHLIHCSPSERRGLLEEAAGVGGIKVRRNEAAAKLKAAETNLVRVGDLAEQLADQHGNLRRQARQAKRYRRLGEDIRRLRAQKLWFGWQQAKRADQQSKLALAAALENKSRAERLVADAAATLEKRKLAEVNLARAEDEARQRFTDIENEGRDLQRNLQSWRARLADAKARLKEWQTDMRSAKSGEQAAAEALERAERERASLGGAAPIERLRAQRRRIRERLAKIGDAERALAEEQKRRLRLQVSVETLGTRLKERREAEREGRAQMTREREKIVALEKSLRDRQRVAASAAAEVKGERLLLEKAQTALRGVELALKISGGSLRQGVEVKPGFENALAACLATPADFDRPWGWRSGGDNPKPPPLPKAARPLRSVIIKAPTYLNKRLDFCGLVDEESGHGAAASLKVGQRLVSEKGALWRWDGYSSPPLDQRTLAIERANLERASASLAAAERSAAAAATAADLAARQLDERKSGVARLREQLGGAETAALAAELRAAKTALQDLSSAAADSLAEKEGLLAEDASLAAKIEAATMVLEQQKARRLALVAERRRWQTSLADARNRLVRLEQRRLRAQGLVAEAAATEGGYQKRIQASESRLDAAAKALRRATLARSKAADQLGESAAAHNRALEAANSCRQEWARAEEAAKPAADNAARSYEELLAQFPQDPQSLPQAMGLAAAEPLPGELERLTHRREAMGEINLRAEADFRAVDERLTALTEEQRELNTAIAKLRRALARLRREENLRMSAALVAVDKLFAELFHSLFGGGEASLREVVDEGGVRGLEVLVRLPGRKRQRLSVLSGGEQALVALSLVFAVFLSNPGPVCVLDEVDAPLDDANADKFCQLLKKVGRQSGAAIIIVTHRPLTMSEMSRLQGVTMAEKGVSDLITVNLEQALEFAS